MIELDFFKILNTTKRYPQQYILNLQECILSEDGNSQLEPFDYIWNLTIKFLSDNYPENNLHLDNIKSDLIMSLYTALFYETTSSTNKLKIAKIIATADPILSSSSSDIIDIKRREIYRSLDNFNIYNDNANLFFNQCRKNSDLEYFKNIFDSKELSKVFNEKDLFYYLKSIKHWPFYYSNKNGMLLSDWFSTVSSLFNNIHNPAFNESTLDIIFSDYILEQFYYPCRLTKTLYYYLNYFENIFEETDTPKRERAIVFSTVFSEAPYKVQDVFADNYYTLLEKYLNGDSNDDFINILYNIILLQYFYFPFAQSALAYLLYHSYNGDMNTMKEKLEDYISTNIDCFNYHEQIKTAISTFKTLSYPTSKKTHNFTDKVRNNETIDTFNYNFTYQFFSQTPYYHYYDRKTISDILSPETYCIDIVKMFLNRASIIENSSSRNYRNR